MQVFKQLGEISPAANGPYETRRARQRLTIPKTTVEYQVHHFLKRKTSFSHRCPLMDLSGGGLAFLADQALKPKDRVSLLLKFPGDEEIPRLEGRVVYALATGIAGYRYRIGVQFLPFTGGRGCNTLKAREILSALEKTHTP